MNRKRYEHKMMNLVKKIRDYGVENKHESAEALKLGKAFRQLHNANLHDALSKYGSYKNIWNEPTMVELRKLYGID